MKLPDDIAQRALDALARPLRSHELADAVWPERADRPLAAKSRAGHAAGRDLIERGVAIQNSDGTYIAAAVLLDEAFARPAVPPELHVGPDGAVVEVQRRTLGRVAAAAEQPVDGELVVDPATGTVTRVVRQVLGHAHIPAPPQPAPAPQHAGSSLIVENGVVMRVTKQVIGSLPPQAPPPQQVPPQAPPPQPATPPNWYPECTAIHALFWGLSILPLDPITRHRNLEELRVRMQRTTISMNAWARTHRMPELLVPAWISTPLPPPPPAPAWPQSAPVCSPTPWAPAPSYAPSW